VRYLELLGPRHTFVERAEEESSDVDLVNQQIRVIIIGGVFQILRQGGSGG
jgi:hypothetical protein